MIGSSTFVLLTWGSIALVGLVFVYEVYAVLTERDIV